MSTSSRRRVAQLTEAAGPQAKRIELRTYRDGSHESVITCRCLVKPRLHWSTRYCVSGHTHQAFEQVVDRWVEHVLKRHPEAGPPPITETVHFSIANVQARLAAADTADAQHWLAASIKPMPLRAP